MYYHHIIVLLLIISSVNTIYILPTIKDESEFCYGVLYFNLIDPDINIKYEPIYYKPSWYNFINATSSINKLDNYFVFRWNIFIEYRYWHNLPISIEITIKLQKYNSFCLANITCYINNFISDTITTLSRFNSTNKYYPLQKHCIIRTDYNTETVKKTNSINNYDLISVSILIFISIIVIIYMIIDNRNIN
ncbi:type-I membrane glycoprotein [NY_014 poxvirus]|uniref:type-I membrane glycoprotein n=1 Tax=NY_014 poxvirus TaxID=2025360 RepID=UPI000B9A0459|nr:type-I membrane glycoprotein [NY_014 poxvirus]AST09554.1 type-I membrane glycoprotein [NY_014 poxvirus]